jgi:cyclase
MQHGADKISVNTAAFKRPALLTEIANRYGSQCAVLAIDTRQEADGKWYVYLNGGRTKTDVLAIDWAITAVNAGAGELLLTAMNNDGEQKGFALDITHQISDAVAVPVIASGGAGTLEHFKDVFTLAHADAALAASIFHFGTIAITDLKQYLINQKIPVRC